MTETREDPNASRQGAEDPAATTAFGGNAGRPASADAGRRQRAMAGGWRAHLFVLLAVSAHWLALSWSLTFHHGLLAVLGAVSVGLVVWLTGRLGLTTRETVPLDLAFRTLAYVPWLTWQVILLSIDVLRRSWHPAAPRVSPETLLLDATQRTHVGLVTYANSITLTPGTLSLEADTRKGTLTVHAVSKEGADELRRGEMDRRVTRVEGDLDLDSSVGD